jgi:hypothetical protein
MVDRDLVEKIERGLQPDPLLREGRSSRVWVWSVAAVLLAAIIVTLMATTGGEQNTVGVKPPMNAPPTTTGQRATPPQLAQPTGRTTSDLPRFGENARAIRQDETPAKP